MTPLNTIIEEEKDKIFCKYDFGYMDGTTVGVIEDLNNDLDTAMQRAYEAGKADSAQENTPDTEKLYQEKELAYQMKATGNRSQTDHTPDTEMEKMIIYDHHIARINHDKKGNIESIVVDIPPVLKDILTSRDTYWKERVRKEVEEAVDRCVMIVNDKVRWAKEADPDEVYEELRVVAGIKEVCEACGERHITNEDNLK